MSRVLACSGGETACGSTCVDTTNDDANCGHCGNDCGGDAICQGGACVCPATSFDCGFGRCCPAGQWCCENACTTCGASQHPCASTVRAMCGRNCSCAEDVEFNPTCVSNVAFSMSGTCTGCTINADCQGGEVFVFGGPFCPCHTSNNHFCAPTCP